MKLRFYLELDMCLKIGQKQGRFLTKYVRLGLIHRAILGPSHLQAF